MNDLRFLAVVKPPVDPGAFFQYGPAGAMVLAIVLLGLLGRYLLSRSDKVLVETLEKVTGAHEAAMEKVTSTHEAAFKELSGEVKKVSEGLTRGLDHVNDAMRQRDAQQQGLFDKNLEVVVRVTESVGAFGVKVADNTRKIGELEAMTVRELAEIRAAVREIQGRPRA